MLSDLKELNPLGIVRTLQSTRRRGYLAVVCLNAAACPRVIDDATFTFRTYKIASVIVTLKFGVVAEESRQKEFLALLA